ncbi:LrgB family protein [Aquisphaera insulae]|uniref:LrgB family protein n=1 Tax=Aquisphaera insulae TaxID=2712864 RepID=UPI0013EA02BA|nr:LrgB family protein [Aquisphaera insulae]
MSDSLRSTAFWSAATIGLYAASKLIHARFPRWWSAPLALTPLLLMGLVLATRTNHRDYLDGTRWLVAMLGPAIVAFAVPIYEQRTLLRRQWPAITVGVLVGSATAMTSAWFLARLFGLDGPLRLSLLPRSMSTPFAMIVSDRLGGSPDLTAIFVVMTGVVGPAMGEALLQHLPLRTAMARGALLGMGAHGAGVAKAHQLGDEEGSVAGVVMVLVGVVNVLAAPILAMLMRP